MRDAQLVADEVCAQIELLTTGRLRKVAMRDGGWVQLFLDPLDGSFWELSYSQSEVQGGGPPTLAEVDSALLPRLYPELGRSVATPETGPADRRLPPPSIEPDRS